jgi:CheY-like chemotaxis protein
MRRVLVIDDDEDILAISRLSLERVGGWQVLTADSGERGIEIAARERPDAVLLDAMMPGLNGPATIERLKASEETSSIPVLFLTAKLQRPERQRYVALGAAGVIAKPFDPMSLAEQMATILDWER